MTFMMNKQREKFHSGGVTGGAPHSDAGPSASAQDVTEDTGQHHAPSIHIHSHAAGHTVHIMHKDGTHTKTEHSHGDAEGIAAHIHKHIGGTAGQSHGIGDGQAGEEEGSGFNV